jgi:ABC-2 type transport system permease protein
MRPAVAAAGAIFRRDLHIYLSYRTQALTQFFSVLFSLALFYYISRLLRIATFESSDAYFAYVVVGLVILSVTQSTLVLSQALRAELVAGTFERILLSPFGPVPGALAMVVFPMCLALFTGFWTLAVAALIFGLHLHWATVALAVPVGLTAALSFSAIAMIVASVVVVFKQAPGTAMIISLIALVSGFYFPIELLPPWIRWVSEVQPFTPAVELMRHFLVGLPTRDPVWVGVVKLVGFVAVLMPLSTWLLALGIRVGQRRGSIIEY